MGLADQLVHISAERFTIKIRSTRFGKNPDRLLASSQPEKPIHPCGTELPTQLCRPQPLQSIFTKSSQRSGCQGILSMRNWARLE